MKPFLSGFLGFGLIKTKKELSYPFENDYPVSLAPRWLRKFVHSFNFS